MFKVFYGQESQTAGKNNELFDEEIAKNCYNNLNRIKLYTRNQFQKKKEDELSNLDPMKINNELEENFLDDAKSFYSKKTQKYKTKSVFKTRVKKMRQEEMTLSELNAAQQRKIDILPKQKK